MYTTLYRVQNRIQNTITYEYMSIVAVTTNAHYRRCSAGAPTESLAVCVTLHQRLSNHNRNSLL